MASYQTDLASATAAPAAVALPVADTRGHDAVPASHARAGTNAGLDARMATHPLVANLETRDPIRTWRRARPIGHRIAAKEIAAHYRHGPERCPTGWCAREPKLESSDVWRWTSSEIGSYGDVVDRSAASPRTWPGGVG